MPPEEGVLDDVQQPHTPTPADEAAPVGVSEPAQEPLADATEHQQPDQTSKFEDRFKQVYARSKEAERQLAEVREAKARLEGELEATRRVQQEQKASTPPVPEYTWPQLQTAIDEGKITLSQAMEYREKFTRDSLQREYEKKLEQVVHDKTRVDTVQQELGKYVAALPGLKQSGSDEQKRALQELNYLGTLGYDIKDPRTEVIAVRAAFGDLDTIAKKAQIKHTSQGRDTMQDIASSGKPSSAKADPITKLTSAQKTHYERMIARGQYPKGWDDVREELAWVKPS